MGFVAVAAVEAAVGAAYAGAFAGEKGVSAGLGFFLLEKK
jgi:hypothetical protein